MDKIKIVHIVGGLVSGGVEKVIYNYFSHMDLDKFEVHIISNSPSVEQCQKQFEQMGFIVHVLPGRKVDLKKNWRETILILKEYQFDILHAHMNLNCFYHTYLGWKCNIKVRIAHSHLVEFPIGVKQKTIAVIFKLLNRLFATDYFACSKEAGEFLFGKANMKKGKVSILKNAIDTDYFQFSKETRNNIREKLKWDDKFVIGHIGRFVDQKNHNYIIDVFAQIYQVRKDARLLLIGSGELKETIEEKVNHLHLNDAVLMLGNEEDVTPYYDAMDLFIFPSKYEGLGIVLIEAQSMGLPCISGDAVPEEVKVTELVQFESIELDPKVFANRALRIERKSDSERIGMKQKLREAGYDIKEAAKQLENYYCNRKKQMRK